MADLLVPLLLEPNNKTFKRICKMLFHDYGGSKGYLTKTELRKPIAEITKELYQTKLTTEIFETLYKDIQKKDKNKVKLKEFHSIVKYLLLSLISYAERINGTSNIDILIETSKSDKYAEIFLIPPNGSEFEYVVDDSRESIIYEDEIVKLPSKNKKRKNKKDKNKKKSKNKINEVNDLFDGDENIINMLHELEELSDETDSDSE